MQKPALHYNLLLPSKMASICYREFDPHPSLQPYVLCYWDFTVAATYPDPYHHHVMPDGCVSLVYVCDAEHSIEGLRLVGPRLDEIQVAVFPGTVLRGIRFWPGASGALLHVSSCVM